MKTHIKVAQQQLVARRLGNHSMAEGLPIALVQCRIHSEEYPGMVINDDSL